MLPRSAVCAPMYMTWQVLELQVMSDMHRCCVLLCYCGTSLCVHQCLPLSALTGELLFAWIFLGESENGCLHTLLTLFELLEDSLDQLLIKAITKLREKVASV